MRNYSLVGFGFVLLVLVCFLGCVRKPAPQQDIQVEGVSKPISFECVADHPHMLWKVQKGKGQVWLLGSIHMADSSFYPLAPVIQAAFDSAEALAVEINVSDDTVAAEVGERMATQGILTDGRTLDQIVGPVVWARVDSMARELGSMGETLLPLKPWLAALQIANLAVLKTGIEASLGIDVVLIDAAYEKDKEVFSLETPAQQIGVFTELPESTQVRYLIATLDEASEAPTMIDSLKYYWKCGLDEPLGKMLLDQELGEKELGDLKEKLYDQRNRVMAAAVEEYLQEERSVFVVVGTAHLLGDGSVIDILRGKGYTLERR